MSKEVNQKDEMNEKLAMWIENNVPDDEEEREILMNWARLCERAVQDKLNIGVDNPESYIAIYCIIFDEILARLAQERQTHSEYSIYIADIVEIGYDDAKDDGVTDKVGNFVPYIYDLDGDNFEIGKKEINALEGSTAITSDELTSSERCIAWVSAHIQKQKKTLNDIATNAVKTLFEEVQIDLSTPVVVYPIFAICHQQLREYVKLLQHESGKSSEAIDVCGNFKIYAQMMDKDGKIAVEYKPDPAHKLSTKSDVSATASHEDED